MHGVPAWGEVHCTFGRWQGGKSWLSKHRRLQLAVSLCMCGQLGFIEGIAGDHKYKERANQEGARPRPRTVRLGKEIAGLNNDLPLAPASSVFVRVDEQNATLWRALITGDFCSPRSALTPEGVCFLLVSVSAAAALLQSPS